jgi:hypothetical protein
MKGLKFIALNNTVTSYVCLFCLRDFKCCAIHQMSVGVLLKLKICLLKFNALSYFCDSLNLVTGYIMLKT